MGRTEDPSEALFLLLPGAEFEYLSWVPTITGNLSFSTVGNTNHPHKASFSNVSDHHERRIFVYQKRIIDDKLISIKNPDERAMWFVLIAESTRDHNGAMEELQGTIHIFHDSVYWSFFVAKRCEALRAALNQYRPEEKPLHDSFDIRFTRDNAALKSHASFSCRVLLRRNGFVALRYVEPEERFFKRRPIFQGNRSLLHTSFSGGPEYIKECIGKQYASGIYYTVSQCFYFLRDIVHEHQHHHPTTDTILDVYYAKQKDWQSQILYKLYGKIIQFKRQKSVEKLSASLGILTYARVFEGLAKTHHAKGISQFNPKGSPVFFHDDTERSLKAALDQANIKSKQKANAFNALMFTLTSFAVLFGFLSLLPDPLTEKCHKTDAEQSTPAIVFFRELMGAYPDQVFIVAVVSIIFVYILSSPFIGNSILYNKPKRLNLTDKYWVFQIFYVILAVFFLRTVFMALAAVF